MRVSRVRHKPLIQTARAGTGEPPSCVDYTPNSQPLPCLPRWCTGEGSEDRLVRAEFRQLLSRFLKLTANAMIRPNHGSISRELSGAHGRAGTMAATCSAVQL